MNFIRRRMLHSLRSRHNPITHIALFMSLLVTLLGVTVAVSEALTLARISSAGKKALAEMFLFLGWEIKMAERHGRYTVEYEVKTNTFEVTK